VDAVCSGCRRRRHGYNRTSDTKPPSERQCSRGALPNFLGCSLDPFPFASAIKCHQKSTCNSAGSSVVRWVLSTPPGPPTGGWTVRPCRASTSLAPLYSPRARQPFGWGSKPPLPLRASSRGVIPGAGALAGYRTPILAGLPIETAVASRPQIGMRLLRGVVRLWSSRAMHSGAGDAPWVM
jgi:hypothetical protein